MSTPLRVGFCGTTEYSALCAQALRDDPAFSVEWVLTPPAKPVGRKKVITPTPLEVWAKNNDIHHIAVETTLEDLRETLTQQPVDYLVVVAFGFLLPEWLLHLPSVAPVNVHPSALPAYRGASPGHFALLFGETESAVTVMRMSPVFDEGAVIASLPFSIPENQTQTEYYHQAFLLVSAQLPHILTTYATTGQETPQPPKSPTPYARRLTRDDGYIPYSILMLARQGRNFPSNFNAQDSQLPDLLEKARLSGNLSPAQLCDRSYRAFHPWPGLWTICPEYKGKENVRMKILQATYRQGRFQPVLVQYEGEPATPSAENARLL